MKQCKTLSLILALILLLTMFPMTAMAASAEMSGYKDAKHIQIADGSFTSYYYFDSSEVIIHDGKVIRSNNSLFPVDTVITKVTGIAGTYYYYHYHDFQYRVTRTGHGFLCSTCDAKYRFYPHIDPLTAADGKCTCGYTFFDNAQMVVLWMSGVTLSPRFTKDKYEYTGKLTRDIDEIKTVSTKLFDALATLEQPDSFKLKKGTNVFEFKVTAEDGKTTKTYTVTIER